MTHADFDAFYQDLHPRILRFLYAHGYPDPHDIAQETWANAWRYRHRLPAPRRDREKYLTRMAKNVVATRARKGRDDLGFTPFDDQAAPDDSLARSFLEMTEGLPERHRRVLGLLYLFALPETMAAAHEGLTINALKSLRHRALTSVRAAA